MIVDKFGNKVDRNILLKNIMGNINNNEIRVLRTFYRDQVFDVLREQL